MSRPVHNFTTATLDWLPYICPVRLEEATPEQLDAMKVTPSNRKISDYVLTLAHDPESLAIRSPLFNAIMYGRDGLSRAGREMGAIATSIHNHCIYCTSVHAARFLQMTGREDLIQEIFAEGEEAALDDYWQPVFDFSLKLTRTPGEISPTDIEILRTGGLTDLEIFDLVCSVAIFGWANRLMHTLGEAITP
ncbi:peroxidase-related enzyme [Gluconobacter sphaericus]|uniref:peroxidase-related enzyme n=1 Tax=Gluconobacter sphaericus TaxID=574987 RepID=UPI0019222AB2|nr:peroxidase-related enzyme [Gluconobacter sphaericus]QQX91593.1 peroxidase-related enzyme [Gluconobacter sphaericus]